MKPLALPFTLVLLMFSAAAIAQDAASPAPAVADGSVSVIALIERVAEDMEQEFIIDPRLDGISGNSTNQDLNYDSLLGILRINGFVAVETAGQILVVPEQNARALPLRMLQDDDSRVSDHEMVTRTISIPEIMQVTENANDERIESLRLQATMLVPVLRPMMTQSAMLGAVPNTNVLVLVDRYDNVRRITAIIDEIIEDLDD